MKYKIAVRLLLLLWVIVVGLMPVSGQESQSLTIFAAASLSDAFSEVADIFSSQNPGVEILFNFGSSSTLATQLAEGAPADLFASANNRQMAVAQDAGRIGGSPVTFVKNRLVLIVPVDNPADIQSLRDLGNAGVQLILAAPAVPVREYTDTMLARLAADPTYGEDFRTAVLNNLVSEEDNVRQVSAKIALGEGDAGVVYLSDVTLDIADQVIALPIPDSLNTIATYPIAITDDTANPELAQKFIDLLLSAAGQAVFVKWGFISVTIPPLPPTISIIEDGRLQVDGQVLNPLALTVDDLRENYTPVTVDVTYQNGEDTVSTNFTGVLLWDLLSAAQVNLNADVRNDKLSTFIVATGSDGYQAVIAWGEIDPEFANQPILVAYAENGEPLGDNGAFRLVVPPDQRGGRYVSDLVNLSLRDAPLASR